VLRVTCGETVEFRRIHPGSRKPTRLSRSIEGPLRRGTSWIVAGSPSKVSLSLPGAGTLGDVVPEASCQSSNPYSYINEYWK